MFPKGKKRKWGKVQDFYEKVYVEIFSIPVNGVS